MFFIVSKIVGFVLQPLNFAILLGLFGSVLALLRWRKAALGFLVAGTLVLVLCAWTSFGALLLHPLEDRFPRPDTAPQNVAGIVVLGGGFEGGINLVRGGYELNSSGDRFVEAAVLARRYPDARVVISGGTGALILEGEADATSAKRLLTALGVAPERLVLEDRSRNTDENARFTNALVNPQAGETWLLVTSAFHMPRSVALFRKNGFPVTAWPTDYRTSGEEGVGLFKDNVTDGLTNATLGIREWVGLVVYRLSGRTDTLLPARE
ncbi:MAG: YdcF family protein [Mesorhizobium amorphae]|nr:MAG: YdcF family protein [Mesorhizobium amorphae]